MSDILLVLWLRWCQFRGGATYWLRVIGIETRNPSISERLYVMYCLIFALAWVVLMWLFAVSQACRAGASLPTALRTDLLLAIPWVVVAAQTFLMYRALRSTPLKLSFADTAYLAGSPSARYAAALIAYMKTVTSWLLAIIPAVALLAVVVDVPLGEAVVNLSGAPAAIATVPLVALSFGLAWMLGLARLAGVPVLRSAFSWLLPILWLVAAYVFPDIMLWTGRVLVSGIEGRLVATDVGVVAVLAVAVIVVMARVSRRADMIQATDESVLYARMSQLGFLARMEPDLVDKIRSEVTLTSRGAWWSLPGGKGVLAAAGRAALSFARHPMNLATAVIAVAIYTYTGAVLILSCAPAQLWLPWLFVLVKAPPRALVREYRADLKERFLRQILPFNNLQLLLVDAALPLTIVVAGLITLAIVPEASSSSAPTYIITVVLVAALQLLCLGLDAVKVAGISVRISHVWATAISFGLVMGLNNVSQGLLLPLVVGIAVILLFATALGSSHSCAL